LFVDVKHQSEREARRLDKIFFILHTVDEHVIFAIPRRLPRLEVNSSPEDNVVIRDIK